MYSIRFETQLVYHIFECCMTDIAKTNYRNAFRSEYSFLTLICNAKSRRGVKTLIIKACPVNETQIIYYAAFKQRQLVPIIVKQAEILKLYAWFI